MDALTGLAWILCSGPGAGSRASLPGHPNVCGGLWEGRQVPGRMNSHLLRPPRPPTFIQILFHPGTLKAALICINVPALSPKGDDPNLCIRLQLQDLGEIPVLP